jgi:hypothetical protein
MMVWSPTAAAAEAASHPDFTGDWEIAAALGAAPPPGLALRIAQSKDAVAIRASWQEPHNGQYGLTLLGVVIPEIRLRTDGEQDLVQVGPFVLHCRTHWDGGRLVTDWTTSQFQGVSFDGNWTRALSPGGREQRLQISAVSSNGARSSAMLTFRRR